MAGRKLRIAVVAPSAVPSSTPGGRGHFSEKMSRLLAERGHDVTVFRGTTGAPQEGVVDGVHYVSINGGRRFRVLKRLTLNRLRMTLSQLGFNLETRRALRRIHRQEPFDVVHCTLNHATGFLQVVRPIAPTVLRCSSHMPTVNQLKYRTRLDDKLTARLESWSLSRASSVYMPSEHVRSLYGRELAGKPNVRVIRTPYDPEFRRPTDLNYEHGRIFFFTAYLEELKGIYDLATALGYVADVEPAARLVVAGSPRVENQVDTATEMQRRAGESADRLQFLGFISRDELQHELSRAHVVALPSHFDNLPNALLEAMHFRSLVVATRDSSLDEVVRDGENGYLCAARDPRDLADAILRAMSDPHARKVRDAASNTVDRDYAPEAFVDNLESYMSQVVDASS